MTTIEVKSGKIEFRFREGEKPAIKPENPQFIISLVCVYISGRLNPKTARKLQAHQGSCVIVGRLAWQDNQLQLLEAGATLIPQQPAEPASQPGATSAPTG